MADTLGDAKIGIQVALDELHRQMKQVRAEIETMLDKTKKDVEINVKTNIQGELKNEFDKVSESFVNVKGQIQQFSDEGTKAISEVTETVAESAGEMTIFQSVVAALGGSLVSAGAVLGVVVVALAELIVAFIAIKKFVGDVIDQVKIYIGQNEELSGAVESVKDVLKLLYDGFIDIYNALRDEVAGAVVEFIAGMVDTWKEMNNATGAGDNLLSSLKNLMSSGLTAVVRVVETVINIFKSFSGSSEDSKNKVDGLTTVVNAFAVVLNGVAFVLDNVSRGFKIVADGAAYAIDKLQPLLNVIRSILSGIAQIASSGLNSIFGINTSVSAPINNAPFGPDPGNFQNGTEEQGPGNQAGKNEFNQYQAPKSRGGSKSEAKEKVIDLEKEEKKILDELISGHEEELRILKLKIELGEANKADLLQVLNIYRDTLQARSEQLIYESNIGDANLKELELRKQIKQISEDDFGKRVSGQVTELQGELRLAAEKDRLQKLDANADSELTRLKYQNEGDILKLKLFDIDVEYRAKEEKLKKDFEGTKKYEELKKQLKISQQIETSKITTEYENASLNFLQEGFGAVTSEIGSGFSSMWINMFGEANSLFEKFFQFVEKKLLEIATSAIFQTVIDILGGGVIGGLIGGAIKGIASFFGNLFAGGGFTGKGADDEPAGIVHRNEFVVSSLGTSIPANRELLEAMNRGEDVATLIGGIERRNIDSESVRAGALSRINTSGFGSGERSVNVNIGGLNVNTEVQKLTGLSENDWTDIVDNEIIPQVSKGLKRAGKQVLDNSIN